jgi:tRNA modification GTPase
MIEISAKTGQGIAELSRAIAVSVLSYAENPDETGGTHGAALGSSRQKNLVDAAIAALEEALSLTGRSEPLDLIAPLLRDAINALGEITGEVSTADILEEMFSRFCVGK